jgi:hypothetical protein
MSDDNSTENIHATGTKGETAVGTENIHATSEPVTTAKPLKADDETAEAGTENIHATDEPA